MENWQFEAVKMSFSSTINKDLELHANQIELAEVK